MFEDKMSYGFQLASNSQQPDPSKDTISECAWITQMLFKLEFYAAHFTDHQCSTFVQSSRVLEIHQPTQLCTQYDCNLLCDMPWCMHPRPDLSSFALCNSKILLMGDSLSRKQALFLSHVSQAFTFGIFKEGLQQYCPLLTSCILSSLQKYAKCWGFLNLSSISGWLSW